MRLTQRIVLNSVVVATLLMAIVLVAVERRVTERVRSEEPVAAQSTDELLAAIRRDIVLAGGAAILVGAVLAQLLARPVARPIEELRDVARGIAAGDLTQRPSLAIGGGEMGDLADALRRLAEQLDARLQALHAEESLLVALTESLNEGVIAVDARQRVVRINDTARTQLRLQEPVPFPADYLPRDRTLREALGAVLAGEEAYPAELRLEERTLSLTARPLEGGGAVLALYDISFWGWRRRTYSACSASWTTCSICHASNRAAGFPIPSSWNWRAWPPRSWRRCRRARMPRGWRFARRSVCRWSIAIPPRPVRC